jgi:hypothetical protein
VVSVPKPDEKDLKIARQLLLALSPEVETFPEIQDFAIPALSQKFSAVDDSLPDKRAHDAAISINVGRKITSILTREILEPTEQKRP